MECPVCFEVFKNPLLLPGCGHTICSDCAELLVQEGNFLRCPECRLVYQLRRGVKSLPKNVALQRTIDEHNKTLSASGVSTVKCESHPDDSVSLYCRTCEKCICLKCYFGGSSLSKADLAISHAGHLVDTSEDVFAKERRLLEEKCSEWECRKKEEQENVRQLEEAEKSLKKLQEDKLAEIDQKKAELIGAVKQAAAKLRFTLQGNVVNETERVQTLYLYTASQEKFKNIENAVDEASLVLKTASRETSNIKDLKTARKKLDGLNKDCGVNQLTDGSRDNSLRLSKLSLFDTDIQSCLADPKKALSYQTESPRTPSIQLERCVISSESAHIEVTYNETVRVQCVRAYLREAMYRGLSAEKVEWVCADEAQDCRGGTAKLLLRSLKRGTMYRVHATCANNAGESEPSPELWFRTTDCDIDMRVIAK